MSPAAASTPAGLPLRRHALLSLLALPGLPGRLPAAEPAQALRFARFGDWQLDFCHHLLQAALPAAGWTAGLRPSTQRLSQARALREVGRLDGAADITWAMTSLARERDPSLRPLRFPIDRGLFGWRVLLVRRGEAARFAGVRSLQDLRELRFVQGHDWPDADILEANGLQVERAANFDSLFAMLAAGRADALPRSVLEVSDELRIYGQRHGLMLEPSLLLHYPTALYYFVGAQREPLARQLEGGLRQLLERGESERRLNQFYADALHLTQLPQRQLLRLRNPLLPPATPLHERALWSLGGLNPGAS